MGGQRISPIFLLSLPRAGSTLLQRMLSVHPEVSTEAEPWFLLPFFYALEEEGTFADYSHRGAQIAITEFLEKLPNGIADYYQAVNQASISLYEKASGGGARYFLDKTPRYALVGKHILRAYPEAKIIFLWRNPLGVLASINETWGRGHWLPYSYKVDLYAGFERLFQAYQEAGDRSIAVNYERLVTGPENEMRRICAYLGIPYTESMIRDFSGKSFSGHFGDPTGVKKYKAVSPASLDSWKRVLNTRFRVRWAKRYLSWIGDERMSRTGYSLQDSIRDLESVKANRIGIGDLFWSFYGNATCYFESSVIRHKMKNLTKWSSVYKHT